jgi:hypothetical protein
MLDVVKAVGVIMLDWRLLCNGNSPAGDWHMSNHELLNMGLHHLPATEPKTP